jgi:hypothetical protein
MKLWMMPLFVMLIALLATSCIKFGDELPDAMDCEITGKLTIWESDKPFTFDPAQPPTVMLMEQRYYTPWSPYRVPLFKQVVNGKGSYEFNYRLEKEKEYYLEVAGYDTYLYLDFAPDPKVLYQKAQKLDVPVVAKSWATPRFINQINLPGDTFKYSSGMGNYFNVDLLIGEVDTVIQWVHTTWGGSQIGNSKHFVSAKLIRNGLERDTKIYYFVPPGDTSVITIRY